MGDLPDESVQMCVTSPPYWGLRKYAGLPDLIWGGEKDCQHEWVDSSLPVSGGVGDYEVGRVGNAKARTASHERKESNTCSLCGAWKGAYGLEPQPELYIAHTIEILREVRRVLRKDGVVFWNIGDSYYGGGTAGSAKGFNGKQGTNRGSLNMIGKPLMNSDILKPKDLCLIPFRVAIAAQEQGWWVRSVIIWNKPNPMPSSVTDRPSTSHEYILMLTKSARYYWDAEAVREPIAYPDRAFSINHLDIRKDKDNQDSYSIGSQAQDAYYSKLRDKLNAGEPTGRNLRSVWTFPTQGYPEAHFATYPEKLVEICVKAATPEVGCCSKCGKPWVRMVEKQTTTEMRKQYGGDNSGGGSPERLEHGQVSIHGNAPTHDLNGKTKTLGWQPQCKCNADKIPSIVLDPFCGSGTSLKVAAGLNRRAIGYELSQTYCDLAVERNRQEVLL